MIKIKSVNKFFNKGKENEIHVVNNLSLELGEKGMVAIFGKSGCGKTTLLNLLGGLDSFSDGEILLAGSDVSKNTDLLRNKYVGYVFQNYNLRVGESCYENIASALRLCGMRDEEEIEKRVTAALRGVGMESFSMRMPETLSGGQQQRIAIARAIVKNPKVILADEPTGNLDSANTVMIMDLLKKISAEHLVVLVTHEENLVDYYCDRVIELSDGRVVSDRENSYAVGINARDKNDIFLGELTRSEYKNENAIVEYYGDALLSPVRLKIINSQGRILVKLETEKAEFIDESSEIKLREGSFEEKKLSSQNAEALDLSLLAPIESKKYGSLFSFSSSVKSGYRENFKKEKKGKKMLRRCMALFSAAVVFLSALFGTAFREIGEVDSSYNHNVFYLYTPSGEISDKIMNTPTEVSGIDYITLTGAFPSGDSQIHFRTASFETFKQDYFSGSFGTNAVFLGASLAEKLPLVCGKREIAENEVLITTKVADALIEKSTLGYIKKREDLLGLISLMAINGRSVSIAGIVESEESSIYLDELAMAKYTHQNIGTPFVKLASDYGLEVGEGECVLAVRSYRQNVEYPSKNDTLKINGIPLILSDIKTTSADYLTWLSKNGIEKHESHESYFREIIVKENPSVTDTSTIEAMVEENITERYFEYYDYLYSDIDGYLEDLYFFEPGNINLWLYLEKGVEKAKFTLLFEEYYKAVAYKDIHGKYPTKAELEEEYYSLPDMYAELEEYYLIYEGEFYSGSASSIYSSVYLLSESDYINASKRLGETHPSAKSDEIYLYEKDVLIDESVDVSPYYTSYNYTLIHSLDAEKTSLFLNESFGDLEPPTEDDKPILSPDDIRGLLIGVGVDKILGNLFSFAIVLLLMCLCMYFIMRSSLMKRIKEIGILRAIGVSKKNLIFRFFIESVVVSSLTVCIGFILSSGFVALCTGASSITSSIFYYPFWLGASVFILITGASVLFGVLPVAMLLRKTPSEILSKYDI